MYVGEVVKDNETVLSRITSLGSRINGFFATKTLSIGVPIYTGLSLGRRFYTRLLSLTVVPG